MNKKIRNDNIQIGEPVRVGPFTIIEVKDGKIPAYGMTRRSGYDKYNAQLGDNIARGRALKALYLKKNRLPIRSIFMG